MVEDTEYYNSDLPYKIVESYYPHGIKGYDIYEVETDDISKIHIVNEVNGIEYEPEKTVKCKYGKDTIHHVSIWKPVQ